MELFSQRNATPPSGLRHVVPDAVRRRILATFDHYIRHDSQRYFHQNLANLLRRQYGNLSHVQDLWGPRAPIAEVVVEHFLSCSHERALDFIEACFRLNIFVGGQGAVDEINQTFRQEGVGYELTRCVAGPHAPGDAYLGPARPEEEFPRILRVDNQRIHAEVVAPALEVLANPVFRVANAEMLKAHTDHRFGRHEDAITGCGSAFESVLKTICASKGWAYDADKDACAVLVDICRNNGLFPPFYLELFKRVGTIRNKLGDAHGRGPTPAPDVEAAHAEHMLHMTSAHVLLLCKLAGLG